MVTKLNVKSVKKLQTRYVIIGAIALILIFATTVSLVVFKRPQVSNSAETVAVSESVQSAPSFKNDTLSLEDIRIKVTDTKIAQPGQSGNEYGTRPALVFYFEVTNISGDNVFVDNSFMENFQVTQDNDPDAHSYLDWALGQKSDRGNDMVKKGGTVASMVGVTLSDLTTPVVLAATNGTAGDVLGTKIIKLQN